MKDFIKDLCRWWDDPMTQSMCAGLGVAVLLGAIDTARWCAVRAQASADDAHVRIDEIEQRLPLLPVR